MCYLIGALDIISMYLIEILLPLYDNDCAPFSNSQFDKVRHGLASRFGGVTAHMRSPAEGIWKDKADQSKVIRDDIVIFEIMVKNIDRPWWSRYREELQIWFRQESIMIRATAIELL